MMNKHCRRMIGLVGIAVLLGAYQNCSDNNMMFQQISEKDLFSLDDVPEISCTQQVEIPLSSFSDPGYDIPEREAEDVGTCYYVKISEKLDTIGSVSSGLPKDLDLTTRNHDVSFSSPDNLHNPYLMALQKLNFSLKGPRKMYLAGGPDRSIPILVDNFVLVGLTAQGLELNYSKQYIAYGTSDSSAFSDSADILMKGSKVPLIPFATGGTSTVDAIALENRIALGYRFKLDVRAIDAGGSAKMSDIYLLIE